MSRDLNTLPLRQAICELVEQDRLQADEIARLRRLAEANRPTRPDRRRWLAAAALGGTAVLGGFWFTSARVRGDNTQSMADEIAWNHRADTPLDLLASNLDELSRLLPDLGFDLRDAQALEGIPGALVGARHCTVASVPALQLRYRNGDDLYSVYQARFDRQRHRGAADISAGQAPVIRHANGVTVCLCNFHGVLVAFAADSRIYAG